MRSSSTNQDLQQHTDPQPGSFPLARTPRSIVLTIALSVFVCEALITGLMSFWPQQQPFIEAALNGTLLVVLLSPALYFILFRPLAILLRLRQQTEAKFKQAQEDQLRSVMTTSLDGFWMNDEQGRLLEVNDAYCTMTGYSRAELLGMSIADLEAKESPEETAAHLQTLYRTGYIFFETRHRRKDGVIIDVEISATAVNFHKVRVYCFARDITAKKHAEAALRNAEAKYHDLYDKAPDMFVSVNPSTFKIVECNETLLRNTGYRKEEIIDHSPLDLYHPDCHGIVRKLLATFRETGEVHSDELQLLRKDGSTIDVSLNTSAIRDENGAIIRSRSIWRDISARKQTEAALLLQSEITANAAEGIVLIKTGDSTIQYCNRRFEQLFGYAPGELLGRHISIINSPTKKTPEETAAAINHQLEAKGSYCGEVLSRRKDGSTLWTFIHVSTFVHPQLGALWITYQSDISARKQSEEALQLAAMVYQYSSEAITVTDEANRIIAVNPAFEQMTGYGADEAMGKNPSFMSSGRHDQAFYQQMWQEISRHGHWHGEMWDKRKNGEIYAKALTINVIKNHDGSVHRNVALFSDITERKQSEELIWMQANFDPLTELPNRRMFLDRLQQEVKKSERSKLPVALLLIDLDQFKEVNDTLGHAVGDALLKEATYRIRSCVRTSDTVARLGGDEFTVILSEISDIPNIESITQKIIDKLAEHFTLGQEAIYISASVGITLYPNDASNIEDLMKNVDQAMYVAKKDGRNRFSYFTRSLQENAQKRLRLINDLRNALAENQIKVYFQPIMNLASGRIYKAEALVRWQHPQLGMISPMDFIPLAEESGLIHEIGDWVFRESARWAKRWSVKFFDDFQISVNKSPVQFKKEGKVYSDAWIDYLQECGVPGRCIVIEITEGLLLNAETGITDKLLKFRDAGIQVAIDDFGTGYSSLSYLKKFDIDYLKIDQSFVRNLATDSNDMALCEAIIVMAHKLGLKVIAEGVETELQKNMLTAAGCDYMQGYLLSRPIPPEELEQYMLQHKHH